MFSKSLLILTNVKFIILQFFFNIFTKIRRQVFILALVIIIITASSLDLIILIAKLQWDVKLEAKNKHNKLIVTKSNSLFLN